MPELSWSTIFLVSIAIVAAQLIRVVWKLSRSLLFLHRLIDILSVADFKTPCEVGFLYGEKYRQGDVMITDMVMVAFYLPKLETRHVVVGRTSDNRCSCEREYCLSFNIRRKSRSRVMSFVHILEGKRA